VERGRGAAGWRGWLTYDGEVVILCRECSEREFGDELAY
jgi:hypothetical protein